MSHNHNKIMANNLLAQQINVKDFDIYFVNAEKLSLLFSFGHGLN